MCVVKDSFITSGYVSIDTPRHRREVGKACNGTGDSVSQRISGSGGMSHSRERNFRVPSAQRVARLTRCLWSFFGCAIDRIRVRTDCFQIRHTSGNCWVHHLSTGTVRLGSCSDALSRPRFGRSSYRLKQSNIHPPVLRFYIWDGSL